jgi:xanthine/CO dehydrogenase XdhC/CoxF family maturation factor
MWKEFFEKLTELRGTGKPFVVATVVKVSGSTYRRPGARVLITEDGINTGLISGGCFEGDLIEKAKRVLKSNQPSLATFDTTSPDDLLFGLGLGCSGVAQILLEPLDTSQSNYLDFLHRCVSGRKTGVLATVFRVQNVPNVNVGGRLMVDENNQTSERVDNPDVMKMLGEASAAVLQKQKSQVRTFSVESGEMEALVEYISLPLPLLIVGAGPDAAPLVRLSAEIGWNVTVVDRRAAFARRDRFPAANSVILTEPEDLASRVTLDATTAAVIMTHHFETDLNFLRELLPSSVFYIGLLGPGSKTDLLFQKLQSAGVLPTEEQLSRLHSPVGLDLGAETPEEIALSIVSEIQAVRSGYPAGFLKYRTGPIHKRNG